MLRLNMTLADLPTPFEKFKINYKQYKIYYPKSLNKIKIIIALNKCNR